MLIKSLARVLEAYSLILFNTCFKLSAELTQDPGKIFCSFKLLLLLLKTIVNPTLWIIFLNNQCPAYLVWEGIFDHLDFANKLDDIFGQQVVPHKNRNISPKFMNGSAEMMAPEVSNRISMSAQKGLMSFNFKYNGKYTTIHFLSFKQYCMFYNYRFFK